MDRRILDRKPVVGLQIDDDVIRHILDKLDKLPDGEPFERQHARYQYRRRGVEVQVEHIGGTESRLRVWTRNLSPGGISLLHGSFIHPGSRCTIALNQRNGEAQEVTGIVRWCRLLSGIVHEIGVQFEEEIPMELFVNVAMLRDEADTAAVEAKRLANRSALIEAADKLMLEIDHLIEPPNLNRAKELCRRMQQIASQLEFAELELAARMAWESLHIGGSVARSEPLLRKVQGLTRQLNAMRAGGSTAA